MTLIVGMNPTKSKYRKGCAWYRLQDWIEELDVGIVAFTNLSHDPHWDKRTLDRSFVLESTHGHKKVVALGGMVSKVLTSLHVDHFTLPHPSPLNRQINDQTFVKKKLEECRNYLNTGVYI